MVLVCFELRQVSSLREKYTILGFNQHRIKYIVVIDIKQAFF